MDSRGQPPGEDSRATPNEEQLRDLALADLRANDISIPHNPTKIDKPFWKYMVSHGSEDAYNARKKYDVRPSPERWGQDPIFCFQRFGRTETKLPDGRIVFIGGEHEDWYDPDFYIYNDVVVVHRTRGDAGGENAAEEPVDDSDWDSDSTSDSEFADYLRERREYELAEKLKKAASAAGADPGDIDIYCYPADVFPGTDFHTATYVREEGPNGKEYIYIIGGLGYPTSPHRIATMTYRLDLLDFTIQRIETTGEAPPPTPGFRNEEKAQLHGGRIAYTVGSDIYVLSLADMTWSKDQAQAENPAVG
ncbi:hypothetical protein VTH82DRAFT_7137 [Thermothelomyces myriococcoides]